MGNTGATGTAEVVGATGAGAGAPTPAELIPVKLTSQAPKATVLIK